MFGSLSPALAARIRVNPVKAGCKNVVLETLKRKSHEIFL
jgi:hypothetical protein